MQSLLNELYKSLLEYLATNKNKLLEPPKLLRRTKNKYSVCSGNFFFEDAREIQSAVSVVTGIIDNTIRNHACSKGETIINNISKGEILDGGQKYFEIRGGSTFEVYCFSCRTLTFIRVTDEKQLFDSQKEWLSIDIDEIQDPLWLEDSQ